MGCLYVGLDPLVKHKRTVRAVRWGLAILMVALAPGCGVTGKMTGVFRHGEPAAEAPQAPVEAAPAQPPAPAPTPEAPAAAMPPAPAPVPPPPAAVEVPAAPQGPAVAQPGAQPGTQPFKEPGPPLPPAIEAIFEGAPEPPPPPMRSEPETYEVVVPDTEYAFIPRVLTIYQGDTVHWNNHSGVLHQLASIPGSDPTGRMEIEVSDLVVNGDLTHTFDTVGTFPYFCFIHNQMTGKIIVLPRS
jgi:plastocyanin